jgi:hypothetical protein
MNEKLWLEKISQKPEKKVSNSDVQTLLSNDILQELRLMNKYLKTLSKSTEPPVDEAKSWFKKIFK